MSPSQKAVDDMPVSQLSLAVWLTGIAKKRSPSAFLFFFITLGAYLALLLEPPGSASLLFPTDLVLPVYRGAILGLCALSVVMLVSELEQTFRFVAAIHAGLALLLLLVFHLPEGNAQLLAVAVLVPLAVYERFPLSVCLCLLFIALCVGTLLARGDIPPIFLLRLSATGLAVGVAGSLTCHYRETIIPLQRHINKLEENVTALARANYLSQDYARDVEDESRLAERQRLTRDIHDAIGYTFTNTIMMMEAVKVMVKTEPERIVEYLENARRNTEEGMAQIKCILRDIRSREVAEESCIWSIKKLVKVFSISTGLSVRFEFGNIDIADLNRFRECVYHFVQEGLINAFRHGRANRVIILMWDYGDVLRITLDDDGVGCMEEPHTGIGIAGMRERAGLAEGRVEIDSFIGGFRISMYLRKGGERAEQGKRDDQTAHRG
jgi:signal transduction histidine kinase